MRSQLLAAITTATSTLTQFAVSQELPWDQNGQPLFRKNMKRVYVDHDYSEETTLFPTLDNQNVLTDRRISNAWVCVDAKNPPTQLDQLIAAVLSCRDRTGIDNFQTESDYTLDKQEDVLILNFEFRLEAVKT